MHISLNLEGRKYRRVIGDGLKIGGYALSGKSEEWMMLSTTSNK